MKISLSDVGKRFNRDWIFRHCTCTFDQGKAYAITGPNGSGKSTLLQIIAGAMLPSEGQLEWTDNTPIPTDKIFAKTAIAAPYLEVIEEMSLTEFLHFHAQFKPYLPSVTVNDIIDQLGLSHSADKQIRNFSSGMKQRVKLAQAIFSNAPLLLLDEPCTNLDKEGYALYHQLIAEYGGNRLVLVSSNDPQEYDFCEEVMSINDFKKRRS